ncbi:MAG: AmmeMemoRadiSam system radical SAM enzyme [Spirochaetes bacterium GWF1_51_8]|nr:MAG: AmmeMemoRadiSam system radical SAM enzyme [Spirochaetes bacterium GWF1_51_8]
MVHPASYTIQNADGSVQCFLCPHHCRIKEGMRGLCGARKNEGGTLDSLIYSRISAIAVDPIEKKPLYHYFPGKMILSIGTVGCNLRCQFCQNHHLSRYFEDTVMEPLNELTPKEALKAVRQADSFGIAYTYSEPSIWFEYILDVSRLLKNEGLKNVWVTNGYIDKEPLEEMLPFMDAANIDLKAFSDKNYLKLGGKLQPVLDTIRRCYDYGVHIELTTLIVPGMNDELDELSALVKWIAAIDKTIPFHISRYFPHYQYEKPSTDIDLLAQVSDMAKESLDYVYLGNVMSDSNTYCKVCGNLQVKRVGYITETIGLNTESGTVKCGKCGTQAKFILE